MDNLNPLTLVARLNVFSHTLGFDTPDARLVCEAAAAVSNRTIKVYTRMVYGTPMIYPANDIAELFLDLTGRQTFAHRDLAIARTLGYTVEQVHDPRTVIA